MAITIPRVYRPHVVYGLLALAVLLPLLRPGFVLTLDMVFTPHIRLPSTVTSSYLFYAVLHVLNIVVPSDILQKSILLAVPYLSGWGMYRLLMRGRDTASLGAYIGGALFVINPFTYSRFMAGQFAVLLGYSLLPFVLGSLLTLMERPTMRRSVWFGIWLTLIGIVSIHTLGLVAVLLFTGVLLVAVKRRTQLPYFLKYVSIGLVVMLVLSCYWLVPLMLGHGTTADAVRGFSAGDQQAFMTQGGSIIGRVANVIRLQGFWAEGYDLFLLPQNRMVGWGLVVLVLWTLIVIGARAVWRRQERFMATLLIASAGIGLLLAVGVLNPVLDVVPFWGGFREPHKFVGLVSLAYAFFAGQGINALRGRYERTGQDFKRALVTGTALLLPIVLTPTMYWGFNGQLRPVQYPRAWAAMNTQLNHDTTDFKVLFLPWHLYMYYGFAGRIIASPATSYFDKSTIVSNQMELHSASPTSIDPQKTLLSTQVLPRAAGGSRLGARLASLRIKYIVLDKDDDYRTYSYLDHQSDLRLLRSNANFRLYQNMAYRGPR